VVGGEKGLKIGIKIEIIDQPVIDLSHIFRDLALVVE